MQEMIIFVYITPPHVNLKRMRIKIIYCGQKEVEIISCLLQNTPSLEALENFQLDTKDEDYYENQFLKILKDISFMKSPSLLATIIVSNRNSQLIHVLGCMITPTISN